MHSFPLLRPPCKVTTSYSFSNALVPQIQAKYNDDIRNYQDPIKRIQAIRDEATNTEALWRYLGQLGLLELRFDFAKETGEGFTWQDAFTKVPITQFSIAYEKAAITFNLATSYMIAAAEAPRTDYKVIFNNLQKAAGVYTYLNDNFLHPPSQDMQKDTVSALITLALAQAQESFLEMVLATNKIGPLVPKLAAETAEMFQQTASLLSNITNIDKRWAPCSELKAKYYTSLAHYQQSILLNSDSQGIAIAHLRTASAIVTASAKLTSSIAAMKPVVKNVIPITFENFTPAFKDLLALITDKLAVLEKENDVVYHMAVPATTPTLERKSALLSPTAMKDMTPPPDTPDLFSRLVSMETHQSGSIYSEEKAKFARALGDEIEMAQDEAAVASSLLEECSPKLPQDIAQGIKEYESSKSIIKAVESAKQSAQRKLNDLRTACDSVDRTASVPHVERLAIYQNNLDKAAATDASLADRLRPHLTILDDIHTLFSPGSLLDAPSFSIPSLSLGHAKDLLAQLKDKMLNEDISTLLLLNKSNTEGVFREELEKFDKDKDAILREVKKVKRGIEEINRIWEESGGPKLRQNASKSRDAITTWLSIAESYKQAEKFYMDLNQLLDKTQHEINSLAEANIRRQDVDAPSTSSYNIPPSHNQWNPPPSSSQPLPPASTYTAREQFQPSYQYVPPNPSAQQWQNTTSSHSVTPQWQNHPSGNMSSPGGFPEHRPPYQYTTNQAPHPPPATQATHYNNTPAYGMPADNRYPVYRPQMPRGATSTQWQNAPQANLPNSQALPDHRSPPGPDAWTSTQVRPIIPNHQQGTFYIPPRPNNLMD